jgi:hypothetical protein
MTAFLLVVGAMEISVCVCVRACVSLCGCLEVDPTVSFRFVELDLKSEYEMIERTTCYNDGMENSVSVSVASRRV